MLLDRVEPLYKSSTSILIETGESDLTRTSDGGSGRTDPMLDQEAVTSQVQVVRSRDLAEVVAKELDLASRAEFDTALAEPSAIDEWLIKFGLASEGTESPVEERVLRAYYRMLSVYAVEQSRVIGIEFSSTDPKLAADAANAIAVGYIAMQRAAKRDVTTDAADFLSAQIADLRGKVVEAESRVEDFRAKNGLFTGGGQTPTTLPEQQLADLNGQLTAVRGERAAAEAKAAQIRAGLEGGPNLNLPEVLNSQLIQRLVEQQVALKSQIAQSSATLLPQHPRMKELSAQLADLNGQITAEAGKILDSVEREAELAANREAEINRNLDELKVVAARANDAGVELRALEREAAAQRDLLDSYLRRYREALAREQTDYLPADARIISRAATPIEPYFPKKMPMTAAAAVTALILVIAFVLLRELASGRPMRRVPLTTSLPVPAGAMTVETRPPWPDGGVVHRLASSHPSLAPELGVSSHDPVAAVAADIAEAGVKRVLVAMADDWDHDERPLAAVALARALTRSDARVVVVDFRGDEANTISMGEGAGLPGVSDLFEGEASFAQVIFRDQRSRVHFISSGTGPLTPDALADERLETILSALTLTYDHVIIDARDELVPTLAPGCGAAVMVVRHGTDDPLTVAAVDRIRAAGGPDLRLLLLDAGEAGGLLARARKATADEAA